MIIYQVLPRLWGNGRLSGWDKETFAYAKSLGVSHVWFTGIVRHASNKPYVKGDPGSPYSISDHYDINPYLSEDPEDRMQEFEDLIARAQSSNVGVILDFIPNHVCADYAGDIPVFDWHDYDWSDTRKIDYSAPGTWDKMLQTIRFWAGKGVNGFRCDMVELVDSAFFRWMIGKAKDEFPSLIFIAEVYQKENYHKYLDAGFDFLYDKSGAYDILMSVMNGGDIRQLSWNWQWLGDMQPKMLNFLENHDEERLRRPDYAALAYASLFNGASFMLYFGQEVDERADESDNRRTSIFNSISIPSIERLVRQIHGGKALTAQETATLERHRDILKLASRIRDYQNYDLLYCNRQDVFPFLRYNSSGKNRYLIVCNFQDRGIETVITIPEDAKKKCHLRRDSISVSVGPHDCSVLPL